METEKNKQEQFIEIRMCWSGGWNFQRTIINSLKDTGNTTETKCNIIKKEHSKDPTSLQKGR